LFIVCRLAQDAAGVGITDSNRPAPLDTNGMSFNGPEGVSGDKSRQGNGNKGANARLATKGTTPRKIVKPDPWARFGLKCPPAGEDRVVLYTTSLRGILKTFEDCNNARFIFKSFNIDIDERDVSIHAEFRHELKELTGKPGPIPQVFIKGRYIGGMDIITQLHEDGTLATLVDGLPPQLSQGECDGCGGVRFVPCSDCSGSTKVLNEAKEVVRCSECNENGLMRCPICN
jgi:glutaredoxin domain-containing cysteine-rich protein 1